MPADWTPEELPRAVGLLDSWLDSMRAPEGYAGPVSHWWDSCLVYTGTMLDWRYEGIICGYLNLYRITNNTVWLSKARLAADDLVRGQLSNGHFHNSSFERGPKSGGTPHEAAVDIALFEVASVLKQKKDHAWETYSSAAETNLQVLIASLWNGQGFIDQPDNAVLVANKNATMAEALFLYQALSRIDMSEYITAAAQVVLSAQAIAGSRAGATIHRGTFGFQLSFGIYTARCLGALSRLMEDDPRPHYRDFIARAVPYLVSLICANGSWLGHYANGRRVASPVWIAPCGDLLRALLQARPWVDVPEDAIQGLAGILIRSQTSGGGIPTAYGLSSRGALHPHRGLPDFRDVLPVVGWCDKAFRALSMISPAVQAGSLTPVELRCAWRNHPCTYVEDDQTIVLRDKREQLLYEWHKGASYPAIINLWT
jgi:hypothetical protein